MAVEGGKLKAGLIVAITYCALITLCLHWKSIVAIGSPVLATAGLAFAACVLFGRTMVPAVFLGSLAGFSFYPSDQISLPLALMLSVINAAVPYAGAWVGQRLRFDPNLTHISDVIQLCLIALLIATLSGSLGGLAFVVTGNIVILDAVVHHILGEAIGIIIVGSLILTWNSPTKVRFTSESVPNLALGLAITGGLSFALYNTSWGPDFLKTWHLFPLMIWIAVSYNVRGISLVMVIVAIASSFATIQGTGPFAVIDPNDTSEMIYSVQQYLPLTAITMMVLAVVADGRRNQSAIEEAATRYKSIVETAVDAIIVINKDSIIEEYNKAAEKIFGYTEAEAIGKPLSILMSEDNSRAHHRAMRDYLATGKRSIIGTPGVQVQACRKNGEDFPIQLAVTEWVVAGKRHFTGIIRDLSQDRRREEARELLAREIDHRAKNALAVVQSLVQLSNSENPKEFITAVRGRIAALARAHSLLSQNKWEGAGLRKIIEDEVGARLNSIDIKGPPVGLSTDAVQPVSMIIHELMTNAIKYGSLSIDTGRVDVSWSLTAENELMLVWKESEGPPVSEPGRRGFGSKLLESLAHHQLNGSLTKEWLRDGLRIVLRLPQDAFSLEGKKGTLVSGVRDEPAGQRPRVLVVEDNALLAMELTMLLEDQNYEVLGPASTMEQGLDIAKAAHKIHAAVLDINLSGRMSFPIAEVLKDKSVPFIFCTGYETPNLPDKLEGSEIINKPVDESILLTRLEEMVAVKS